MDGTFTQCFPRHLQELFARTYVTSLILTLSKVSCGGDFLPYRSQKKGNTILWAGNTQKMSDIGAFTCITVQSTSFHMRAWCVPGLGRQAEAGLQHQELCFQGSMGFATFRHMCLVESWALCVAPPPGRASACTDLGGFTLESQKVPPCLQHLHLWY